MPLTKINFNTNESVIYKIYCIDGSCVYIYFGSTTNFTKRKQSHKSICNNEKHRLYNIKLYKTIRENGGWDNWKMALVEVYPCQDKKQLRIREQFYIDQQLDKINDKRAYVSEEEGIELNRECKKAHYQANRDTALTYQKKHYEANRDTALTYQKKRYEANKEAILAKHKAYKEKNKVEISVKNKARYQARKAAANQVNTL